MQNKTIMRYHYTPVRIAKPKKTDYVKDVRTGTIVYSGRRVCKPRYWHYVFGEQFGSFVK